MSKIVLGFTQAVGDLVEVALEVYGIEHGWLRKVNGGNRRIAVAYHTKLVDPGGIRLNDPG